MQENWEKVRAWPFAEARRLHHRLERAGKKEAVFQTGYGPSGLPHIGTFGEVLRTSVVRQAFEAISALPTRLIVFSDDMDGLRKVPENIPNPEALQNKIGLPLTSVPDPFGTHPSFGEHNNARLRAFLDKFGFDYEFISATECYQSGRFDDVLLKVLEKYETIKNIILPTLGEERQKSYSPFLPICPETNIVLQVPVTGTDPVRQSILYQHPNGRECETKVTGGLCKLQWKPDWAMRWYSLGVDYEMAGKDLTPSFALAGKIIKALGGRAPENLAYELFLDEAGEKISKSRGNGITVDDWLSYAPPESLALFMYKKPKTAKRLYFDVIPRQVDEYMAFARQWEKATPAEQLENPVWYLNLLGERPEIAHIPEAISFSMLHNLVGACQSDDPALIWRYIQKYSADASPEAMPWLDALVGYAIRYYKDFIAPTKNYHKPDETEKQHLFYLVEELKALKAGAPAEDIQTAIFNAGKKAGYDPIQKWFGLIYSVLTGQMQGPRLGPFFHLYGLDLSIGWIEKSLKC